jgi:hypothetical protein
MFQEKQMVDLEKLPSRVKAIVERVRHGERLCKSFRFKETGETEVTFYFEPSGKRAGPVSAQAATETEFLAPCNDGLFTGTDQTWTAAK